METIRLGKTNMMVSRLGFGGIPIQRVSEDEAVAVVRRCLELGITFIDTANVDEIREACSLGVIDGVTTNPTLVSREGRPFEEVIREICSIVDGPISAEVVSMDCVSPFIGRLDDISHNGMELVLQIKNQVLRHCLL